MEKVLLQERIALAASSVAMLPAGGSTPMMRVWSHRPHFLHLGLFTAAYVLGCGFAQSLAIVPGTGISIWPPAGLFIATLVLAPMHSWPWWVLAGCLAELFSNFLWFHSPLPAAFLIYVGNALEAVVGAWLVNRICRRPVRLETLQEVLALVVLGAGIAPVLSATVGSATLVWFGIQSQSFATAWSLWWIGDATGVLLVAPLALVVLQNWHSKTQLSSAQWMEAGALGLVFLGVAALSMSNYYLPFAYIIMPPLLWAAVRFEFKGAAVALSLLALLTVALTISGGSQFVGDPESQRQRQIMLQLFLAISAFSALIVAAISRQHQQALLTLRESERELSQLVDLVPVHIRRLTPQGETIFFNKRLIDFVGMDLTELRKLGMSGLAEILRTVIHPDDLARHLETVHHSLATGEAYAMKYRVRRADGVYRWMEGRGEPLRDQAGAIVQWYGISIDIDDEMRAQQAEEALRHASDKLAQATHAASLAELSASVAHEVNQPLAAIVANSHACQRWLSAEPPNVARAKITVERIIRDANSAADVISRIRGLFKQSVEPRNSVALTSVVAEARDLMAEEATQRRIRLDVDVESDVPPIAFDRVQIQQVLINLIRNGMDAMDSTSDKILGIRMRRAGDVIRTEISDRGRGVEFPDRIFDPFYTTKEHGMGMGLAISRSIVESHRGRLWMENNNPHGATFIFTLPVEAKAAP